MCTRVLRPRTGMKLARVGLMGLLCLTSARSDARIVRGDVDLNLQLDINDPVGILFHLFIGIATPTKQPETAQDNLPYMPYWCEYSTVPDV